MNTRVRIHVWARDDSQFGFTVGEDGFTLTLEQAVTLHHELCEALAMRIKVLDRERLMEGLPQPGTMQPINITDGLSSEEHVAKMRGR